MRSPATYSPQSPACRSPAAATRCQLGTLHAPRGRNTCHHYLPLENIELPIGHEAAPHAPECIRVNGNTDEAAQHQAQQAVEQVQDHAEGIDRQNAFLGKTAADDK